MSIYFVLVVILNTRLILPNDNAECVFSIVVGAWFKGVARYLIKHKYMTSGARGIVGPCVTQVTIQPYYTYLKNQTLEQNVEN